MKATLTKVVSQYLGPPANEMGTLKLSVRVLGTPKIYNWIKNLLKSFDNIDQPRKISPKISLDISIRGLIYTKSTSEWCYCEIAYEKAQLMEDLTTAHNSSMIDLFIFLKPFRAIIKSFCFEHQN